MRRASILLLLTVFPLTSCAVAAVAGVAALVGYVQYDKNKAHRDFAHDFDTTWDATLRALDLLEYPMIATPERTRTEGSIEGEDFKVRVELHPEGFTCVAVRIGNFSTDDHRRRATLVLNEVGQQLGEN